MTGSEPGANRPQAQHSKKALNMKISNTFYHRIALLTLCALLSGCGSKKAPSGDDGAGSKSVSTTGIKAVYRSDANVYGTISMTANVLSPLGDAEDADTKEKMARIKEVSGLEQQDIQAFTFCGLIEDISMSDITEITDQKKVPLNIAITLAKAVDYTAMVEVMKILNEDTDPDALYEDTKIESHDVMKLTPSDDVENPRYATLANDGKTVYIAMAQSEIMKTLHHEISGQPEQMPANLNGIYSNITNAAPVRLAMLMPDSVRADITDKYNEIKAEGGLAAAMMGGMYTPFTNMQSIAISGDVDAEENLDLTILGDLASEEAANKGVVAMTMITGLVAGLMPVEEEGDSSFNFAQALKTSTQGKHLVLKMKLPKEEIEGVSAP